MTCETSFNDRSIMMFEGGPLDGRFMRGDMSTWCHVSVLGGAVTYKEVSRSLEHSPCTTCHVITLRPEDCAEGVHEDPDRTGQCIHCRFDWLADWKLRWAE